MDLADRGEQMIREGASEVQENLHRREIFSAQTLEYASRERRDSPEKLQLDQSHAHRTRIQPASLCERVDPEELIT